MSNHRAGTRLAALGMSGRELARRAGTHQSSISFWLTGSRGLSKGVAARVARALAVPVEWCLYEWPADWESRLKRWGRTRHSSQA